MGQSGKFQIEAFLRKKTLPQNFHTLVLWSFGLCEWIFLPDIEKMLKLNSNVIKEIKLPIDSWYYEKYT
jgi:hypothetical protein